MQQINSRYESLALSIIHVLIRSKDLKGKDQYALLSEFNEWIVKRPLYFDICTLPDMTSKKFDSFTYE